MPKFVLINISVDFLYYIYYFITEKNSKGELIKCFLLKMIINKALVGIL